MFIQLDEDFRMKNDPNNLILEKRSIVKKEDGATKEIWVNDGYYTSINGLLNGYLRKSVIKSSASTLGELANDIKRIEKNIDKLSDKFKR